jgi:hypothetical protein
MLQNAARRDIMRRFSLIPTVRQNKPNPAADLLRRALEIPDNRICLSYYCAKPGVFAGGHRARRSDRHSRHGVGLQRQKIRLLPRHQDRDQALLEMQAILGLREDERPLEFHRAIADLKPAIRRQAM